MTILYNLYNVGLIHETYAISPSFPIQQVIDGIDDWQVDINRTAESLYKNTATSPNDCTIKEDQYGTFDFPSPDMSSLSYVSDGKTLNATLWLASSFIEPAPSKLLNYSRATIELAIEDLSSAQVTLQAHTNKIIHELKSSSSNKNINSILAANVAGVPAYLVEYTKSYSKIPNVKIMEIWAKQNDKIYSINYTAEFSDYDRYLPKVQDFIDSFRIDKISRNIQFQRNQNPDNFLTYQNSTYGIEVNYPSDWTKDEERVRFNKNTIVKFNSPFENLTAINRNYGISIDVQSDYKGTGGDYLSLIQWDNNTKVWNEYLFEIGFNGSAVTRTLATKLNFTNFFEKGKSFVTFTLPLNSINNPDKYSIIVAPYDTFLKGDLYCEIADYTRWYTIPPPRHEVTMLPNVVELRPGEQKDLKLDIEVSSITNSKVDIMPYNNSGIETNFDVKSLSLPPDGKASTKVKIKALENAALGLTVLNVGTRLIADGEAYFISTGLPIDSTAPSFYNKDKNATISITVLPPLTFDEHLNKFYTAWLAPLSAIWGFIIGIATVVAPLILRKYKKEKNKA